MFQLAFSGRFHKFDPPGTTSSKCHKRQTALISHGATTLDPFLWAPLQRNAFLYSNMFGFPHGTVS